MRRPTVSVVIALEVALVIAGLVSVVSLMAQSGNAPKPLQGEIGTWKINLAKSKYDPGPPPQSATVSMRELTAEGVKVTNKGLDAQGKPFETRNVWIYDGKERPVTGNAAADTVSRKRLNDFSVWSTLRKGRKVVQTNTLVFSKDGKMVTLTQKGTDAQGRRLSNVVVWEKQ